MIAGYRDIYLDDVMEKMGIMFYLCGYFNIDKDAFWDLLVSSGVDEKIERGIPRYLTGLAAVEMMTEIVRSCGQDFDVDYPDDFIGCENGDYWMGWILSFYQWKSGMSFSQIHDFVKASDFEALYPACHQENEVKVCGTISEIIFKRRTDTNLQKHRTWRGLTQEQLAQMSGVNVRSIRAYEQQTKEISRASAEVVFNLARVLGCSAEQLL